MSALKRVTPLLFLVALPACYHATIETGLAPSTTVIDKPWASSFIYGLVPPSTIETKSKCTNGVAKVETQHSFLNYIVGSLTFGIYTPIAIKVTCAQGGRASIPSGASTLQVGADATPEVLQGTLRKAVELSFQLGVPVYVTY